MDETKKDEKVETATTSTESSSEPKKEEKKEEKKVENEEKKDVEIPAKFKKIVEEVEKMSVLDLNELVKVFEDRFGVSATAVAPQNGVAVGPVAEEKTEFTIELVNSGEKKIAVIKAVKEALTLGLKDAKDKVDAAPIILAENMKKEEAENLKKAIEEAGGKVNLK